MPFTYVLPFSFSHSANTALSSTCSGHGDGWHADPFRSVTEFTVAFLSAQIFLKPESVTSVAGAGPRNVFPSREFSDFGTEIHRVLLEVEGGE